MQPNGPVEDDQKKTRTATTSTLIPVLAVGFGCPCHGGQYDTEGNRTAGPPVRALDRAEFSIRDGNLCPRQRSTASPRSRAPARAPGSRSTAAPFPGVHVDGPSAWLYPIEVPK